MVEPIEHRRTQHLKRGERQFHLRLDTGRPRDQEAARRLHRVLEQRRLADAGLAAKH